ncbi:histidinol-phosphate aminotransferase [compost metagenome]
MQAQSKAEECLSQSAFYEEQKRKVLMIKDNARRIMEEWGFTVLPSSTNFLCSTHKNIESYKQRWRQMNIAVNELSAYQSTWLHNYVRISMEDEDKIDLFIQSVCKNAVHI